MSSKPIESAIATVLPERSPLLLPFVGTLWLFVAVANLIGLIPGLHAPTGDLSTTAALAIVVFLSVHWYGIRSAGLRAYLRHYLSPSPVLLPFHLLGEFSRTLALAVRLFGNIMSLEMAALLVLLVAGLLVPVPVLMLHVIEALVQAYIFGMLALIYIAGGMQSQAEQASTRFKQERKHTMSDMHWFALISTVVAGTGHRPGHHFSGDGHGQGHHPGTGGACPAAGSGEIHYPHPVHRSGDDRVAGHLRSGDRPHHPLPQSTS